MYNKKTTVKDRRETGGPFKEAGEVLDQVPC